MPAPIAKALRERILAAYQEGKTSTAALARRFAVSQPTVSRLLQRFQTDGTIEPKPHGGGMPSELSPREQARLVKITQKKPTLTGSELGRLVRPGKKKKPQKWVIWRALKLLGFSKKKASFEADEKTRPDIKKRYQSFTKRAKKTDPSRLVFLDETGIDRSGSGCRAWARFGEDAKLTRPGTATRRSHTVIGAMRMTGLLGMRSLRGGMKKKDFLKFIANVLCPRLRRRDIVVMDNLNCHHGPEVLALIQSRGATIAFLPPYSPELNPIEMLWSTLKRRFAKRFQQAVQKIGRAIGGAWRSLKNTDLSRLLPACGYSLAIQPK